ncbi:MAG: hypothetical protein ACXWLM_08600 [Myxococcales bacterium]
MVLLFARSGAAALVLTSAALGLPNAAHAPEVVAARHQPAALGAGSWAQARSLRIASAHLTARLSRAARCEPAQDKAAYRRCVLPALRGMSMAGRTTARLAAVVASSVPPGRCRGYLLVVQAANAAADEQGAYLLSHLYVREVAAAQRQVDAGLERAAAMLRRAAAAPSTMCAARQRADIWARPLPELSP